MAANDLVRQGSGESAGIILICFTSIDLVFTIMMWAAVSLNLVSRHKFSSNLVTHYMWYTVKEMVLKAGMVHRISTVIRVCWVQGS